MYLNGQWWTRIEVLMWLLALTVALVLGALVVTDVLGSRALLVAPLLALGVGLMRHRAEVKWHAQRRHDPETFPNAVDRWDTERLEEED